jgi:hypothetical protein
MRAGEYVVGRKIGLERVKNKEAWHKIQLSKYHVHTSLKAKFDTAYILTE